MAGESKVLIFKLLLDANSLILLCNVLLTVVLILILSLAAFVGFDLTVGLDLTILAVGFLVTLLLTI